MVPKLKITDVIKAAFDPHDDPTRPPKQSASEQQVRSHMVPFHGLRIWDVLVGYFVRRSSEKAQDGTKHATAAVKGAAEQLGLANGD